MHQDHLPAEGIPNLTPGVTVMDVPTHRSSALHQIAINTTQKTDGETIWVDARNTASSQLLIRPGRRRRFADIRLARAFTAYQHHELIRTLPSEVTADTTLVVAPCVTSLYQDDDVPSPEDDQYLRASMAILDALSESFDIPVLISCAHEGELRDVVDEFASTEIEVEETSLGYRFTADEFETLVYWGRGYWQTTIPYWVDLLGVVDEARPVETAIENGLLEATI